MKIYRWLFLCLLFSCGNEKKPTQKVQTLPDTTGSFYSMLRLQRNSKGGNYEDFVYFKKLFQISDTGVIKKDYEIRLYKFGGMRGPDCFRYTFHKDKWHGERRYFEASFIEEGENPKGNYMMKKDSIRPKYGWKVFVKNATDNGLLDMPTNEAIAQEYVKLSKIYPEKADRILNSFNMDAGYIAIEIISKDHYDFRLYEDRELHNAGEYKGLIMIERLNKLIKELIVMKYETYP